MPRGWDWRTQDAGWAGRQAYPGSDWQGSWRAPQYGIPRAEGAAVAGDSAPTGGIFGRLLSKLRGFQSPTPGDDPILREMRDMAMADAAAQQRGARSAARVSAPDDPSLASWADLNALIGGQSDVSRGLMGAAYGRLSEKDRRGWEEYMLRLRTKLEEDAMRRANAGGFLGELGEFGGGIMGSWLSPGGWFKGKH